MARRISDENGPNSDPWVSEIVIGSTTITAGIAASLADVAASTPISTVTVSSPVNYVDIDLPTGYSAFHLDVSGYKSNQETFVVCVFSQNGGATWLEDYETTNVAYSTSYYQRTEASFSSGSYAEGGMADMSVGIVVDNFSSQLFIDPGSATSAATVVTNYMFKGGVAANPTVGVVGARCLINTQRIDAVRIVSLGSTIPDPLFSITSGSFSLYGVL